MNKLCNVVPGTLSQRTGQTCVDVSHFGGPSVTELI